MSFGTKSQIAFFVGWVAFFFEAVFVRLHSCLLCFVGLVASTEDLCNGQASVQVCMWSLGVKPSLFYSLFLSYWAISRPFLLSILRVTLIANLELLAWWAIQSVMTLTCIASATIKRVLRIGSLTDLKVGVAAFFRHWVHFNRRRKLLAYFYGITKTVL